MLPDGGDGANLLSFIPSHDGRPSNFPQPCEQGESCEYEGGDNKFPFIQEVDHA